MYGGTERVVSYLTDELVRRGHDVTLFASGDSDTTARLVPVRPRSLRLDPNCRDQLAHHVALMELVSQHAPEYDLVHYHTGFLHFPLARRLPVAHVTTMHGRLDLADLVPLFGEFRDLPLVSISRDQRRPLSTANWVATVHHGVPADRLPFSGRHEGYLAFVGRISPEKRVDRAIAIARRAGLPLRIGAKVDAVDQTYYQEQIVPLLAGGGVEYLGEIGEVDKARLMGGALALLFPIDWPEPFGLVMIEAMACGTPVIAWRQGSVPEVVDHGQTGFIVESVEEAVAAVDRLSELDRRTVRRIFDERFTASTMASNYLTLYQKLLREPDPMDTALSGVLA